MQYTDWGERAGRWWQDRRRSIGAGVLAALFFGVFYVAPELYEERPLEELTALEAAERACQHLARVGEGIVADRPPNVELLEEMVSAAQHAADQEGRYERLARSATALRGAVLAFSRTGAIVGLHQMTVLCQPGRLDGLR